MKKNNPLFRLIDRFFGLGLFGLCLGILIFLSSLFLSLRVCPFDRMYAVKPRNPE
jgi:uncharacterized membrane protein required for colicin V production